MAQSKKEGLTSKMALANMLINGEHMRGDYGKEFVKEKYPELYEWFCEVDIECLRASIDLLKDR